MVRRRKTLKGGEGFDLPGSMAKFFKEKEEERREELKTVGDRARQRPAVVENVGQNPKTRSGINSASSSRRESMSAGRRRRTRRRRHSRRRR